MQGLGAQLTSGASAATQSLQERLRPPLPARTEPSATQAAPVVAPDSTQLGGAANWDDADASRPSSGRSQADGIELPQEPQRDGAVRQGGLEAGRPASSRTQTGAGDQPRGGSQESTKQQGSAEAGRQLPSKAEADAALQPRGPAFPQSPQAEADQDAPKQQQPDSSAEERPVDPFDNLKPGDSLPLPGASSAQQRRSSAKEPDATVRLLQAAGGLACACGASILAACICS